MKTRQLFAMIVTLFCIFAHGSLVQAAEQQASPAAPAASSGHAGHTAAAPADADHSGHDMGSQTAAAPQTATVAHLESLRTKMAAIKASTNPEERNKLMQDHLAAMTTTLTMLKDAGSCPMMQSGMCPMMQKMQHGQEQGAKMQHGGSTGMGHGGMGMGHMAKCREMKQLKADLTNGLLEQLIEMQGQLLNNGK
jgi:hypothetical protein